MTSDDGTTDYSYDTTSQITAADHSYQTDEAYSYDANGNRTMTGYDIGTNNRLLDDGTYTYEYDDEGNRISRTLTSDGSASEYEWDFRNRLLRVTEFDEYVDATAVVEYTYDVFDRQLSRSVDTTSPFDLDDAVVERYVYDDRTGVSSSEHGNVVLDFTDLDGSGSQAIALSQRYLYSNTVDHIVAQEDVSETIGSADRVLWHLADHLGTVRDLQKNDVSFATHYEYDSFGNVISGDTDLTRYLFTGRELDDQTGLQYNRARWYDEATGSWTSPDPIDFNGQTANLYTYVGNAPTAKADPSGLAGEDFTKTENPDGSTTFTINESFIILIVAGHGNEVKSHTFVSKGAWNYCGFVGCDARNTNMKIPRTLQLPNLKMTNGPIEYGRLATDPAGDWLKKAEQAALDMAKSIQKKHKAAKHPIPIVTIRRTQPVGVSWDSPPPTHIRVHPDGSIEKVNVQYGRD
jgi:RHS repeat-associated protein